MVENIVAMHSLCTVEANASHLQPWHKPSRLGWNSRALFPHAVANKDSDTEFVIKGAGLGAVDTVALNAALASGGNVGIAE